MSHEYVLISGFAFMFSLIVVVGSQNAFVLRQGILGVHVPFVVAFCIASDVVLTFLGVSGVGILTKTAPGLTTALSVAGACFLIAYGLMAARRALWRPAALRVDNHDLRTPLLATLVMCIACTWLNPHVYLDTVVLLGSVANAHPASRWWFWLGSLAASALWFTSLGFGARLLRPVFSKEMSWRVLDGVIASIMAATAVVLLLTL